MCMCQFFFDIIVTVVTNMLKHLNLKMLSGVMMLIVQLVQSPIVIYVLNWV
jgi:hypothetical protein